MEGKREKENFGKSNIIVAKSLKKHNSVRTLPSPRQHRHYEWSMEEYEWSMEEYGIILIPYLFHTRFPDKMSGGVCNKYGGVWNILIPYLFHTRRLWNKYERLWRRTGTKTMEVFHTYSILADYGISMKDYGDGPERKLWRFSILIPYSRVWNKYGRLWRRTGTKTVCSRPIRKFS